MARKLSKEEWERRINEAGAGRYEFIRWDGEFKNCYSMALIRCSTDNYECSSRAHNLVNIGSGCPQCAGRRIWTAEERIEQINSLENIEFISWVDWYKGSRSKANVRCEVDGFEWTASVGGLVNNTYGCHKCAKYGYDKSKTGTLYALRSECGQYVKVGISNDPKRRHKVLEIKTPFKFNIVEQFEGGGAKIAELEKYFHDKYERAGFVGFDGATEWLVCTPQLLEELRELEDVK